MDQMSWREFERFCEELAYRAFDDSKWRVKVQRRTVYDGEMKVMDIHVAERRQGGCHYVFDCKHFRRGVFGRNEIDDTLVYKRQSRASKAVILASAPTSIPQSVESYAKQMGVRIVYLDDRLVAYWRRLFSRQKSPEQLLQEALA